MVPVVAPSVVGLEDEDEKFWPILPPETAGGDPLQEGRWADVNIFADSVVETRREYFDRIDGKGHGANNTDCVWYVELFLPENKLVNFHLHREALRPRGQVPEGLCVLLGLGSGGVERDALVMHEHER